MQYKVIKQVSSYAFLPSQGLNKVTLIKLLYITKIILKLYSMIRWANKFKVNSGKFQNLDLKFRR